MSRAGARRRGTTFLAAVGLIGLVAAPARAIDTADALRSAAHQLVRVQRADGLFEFDYDFTTGAAQGAGRTANQRTAHLVRQAVAAYALAKYGLATGDPAAIAAAERAVAALGDRSVPIGDGRIQRWIEASGAHAIPWGRRTLATLLDAMGWLYGRSGDGALIAADGDYATAWAGGTAVALLAELEVAAAGGGSARTAALRRSWLSGLLALHVAGAGFREYPGSIEDSPLAHAEIWHALSSLPPAERASLGDRLAAIDRHMLETYTAAPTHHFFHWGVMAVAQRGATLDPEPSRRLVERLTRHVLDTLDAERVADENTCTIVEGLAAAARVLAAAPTPPIALLDEIRRRLDVEMTKNLALQIAPGQTEIARPDGSPLPVPPGLDAAGAFLALRTRPFIRVDYTGHCISALVEMTRAGIRR